MAANATNGTIGRMKPSSLGEVAIVLASAVLSLASYRPLADTVRIRWTVGSYRQYGPEYVSTLPVLVAFPVIVAALYIGARWLERYLERSGAIDDDDEFRVVYAVCVLLTLGTVVAAQLVVIVLNL